MANIGKGIFGKPIGGAKPLAAQAKKSGNGAPNWQGKFGNPFKGK